MRIAVSVVSAGFALLASSASFAQTAPPPPAYPPPPPPPGYAYPPGTYAYPPPPLPPPPEPSVPEKKLGIGFKMGNTLGLLGADIIVAPIEHIAIDAQFGYQTKGDATGTGYSVFLQGRLKGNQDSTPYLGVGFVHAALKLGSDTDSGSGFAANVGYEWRWNQGLGILLGGGVVHMPEITVTDGLVGVTKPGGWNPNLEFGVRFAFL